MSRIVQIPPVAAPGAQGGTGRMYVLLSLVDATGTAIPASDASNTGVVHGLGVHVVTDQQVDLELSTQAELTETTYYRVVIRQGRDEWRRDVQIPAGDWSPLTWAQFLAFEDPVTANLAWASRLLPSGATDGQFATYDAATGLWEPISVAPGSGLGVGDDAALLGSATATDGQVLTADGLGGAGWEDSTGGGGAGDLSDGDTLTTGLTFPVAGLHILDTNATHDLILSPGSNLTADRTLTLTTGDANRTLTLTADASIAGTNTGDQDLSGYCLKSLYDANTIVVAHTDNTPVALTVAEQTLVGRITGGSIDDLSPTQVRTLLNVADGAVAAGTAGDAYAVSHEADTTAHPASSIVNTPAGDIIATTVQAAINELDTEKAAVSHTQPEASITFTDITTGNVTVLAHGFIPKLSGVTEQYFNGNGGWTTPSGSGSGTGSGLVIIEASSIGGSMTCQFTENTSF